jgi:hypothetical protein
VGPIQNLLSNETFGTFVRFSPILASALGALVLAVPMRSAANWSQYDYSSQWGSAHPYTQRYYDDADDYNRFYDDEGQSWRDGQGMQHEREELEQARDAQHQHWNQFQHERQEMDEARRARDWDQYRHERREAQAAAEALARDQAHIEHERQELRDQQRARWHRHQDWDD